MKFAVKRLNINWNIKALHKLEENNCIYEWHCSSANDLKRDGQYKWQSQLQRSDHQIMWQVSHMKSVTVTIDM